MTCEAFVITDHGTRSNEFSLILNHTDGRSGERLRPVV